MIPNTVSVLLVEDDMVDQMAIKRAFKEAKIVNPIIVAKDGIEALEILRGQGGHEPLTKPYFILLDINMPRMNGIEFLKVLRSEAEMRQAVVFVLTTSASDSDRGKAHDLNVAGYILKSNVGEGFKKLVQLLEFYWNLVELPPASAENGAANRGGHD